MDDLVYKITLGGSLILLLIFSLNTVYASSLERSLTDIDGLEEALEPAELEVYAVESDYAETSDEIFDVVESLNSSEGIKAEIKFVSSGSEKGGELISDYGLEKLPTVVIEGEVDKVSFKGFEEVNNAFVKDVEPPYYSVNSQELEGLVEVYTVEAPDCERCTESIQLDEILEDSGVYVETAENISPDQADEKGFDAEIERAPAYLVSEHVLEYEGGQEFIEGMGFEEINGGYRSYVRYPAYNFSSQQVNGLVDMVKIGFEECDECYDEEIHTEIVQNIIGPGLNDVETKDVTRSGDLVEEYEISQVPTFILQGDMDKYPELMAAWEQVGTVEEDGTFVFRNLDILELPYYDLNEGELVR